MRRLVAVAFVLQLAALLVAVILLTVQAFIINRICGVAYPFWRAPDDEVPSGLAITALCTEATSRSRDAYSEIADRLASRHNVLSSHGQEFSE